MEVPAGSFDCYKVELNINQTFWYSTDAHRYLVKFEGGGVIAELASIAQQSPVSPVTYQDPTDHFSLRAPAGWVFDRTDGAHGKGYTVAFLDPGAMGMTGVDVKSLEKTPAEKKSSLRTWAESEAEEAASLYKDFKVRADSWKERTVGGQPAISLLADYTAGKDKNIAYAVLTMSGNKGLLFECMVSAKDFEALQPEFDAIVDSYKSR